MISLANWVEELTTTTGVGPLTLGTNPITGSTTFLQGFGSGVTEVPYSIRSGNNRETGIGSFNGTTQVLTRTTVLTTLVSGVYDNTSPAPINVTGTSTVSCSYNASLYREGDSAIYMRAIVATGNFTFENTGVSAFGWDAVNERIIVRAGSYSTATLQPIIGLALTTQTGDEFVDVLVRGIHDMDTSSWAVNDRLWQGGAGSLTNVKPPITDNEDEIISLGVVLTSSVTGKIFFEIDSFGNGLATIEEPSADEFAYVRENGAWVRGGRILEGATEPIMAVGDTWFES